MIRRYKINYDFIGGSSFYLPCEITHFTSHKYYKDQDTDATSREIKQIISSSNESVFSGLGYYQDPYVQIYNGINYKNFYNIGIIFISNIRDSKFTDEYQTFRPSNQQQIEQSKGGNFISAPNNVIFCVSGANDELLYNIRSQTQKQIIELECSFKAGISEEFPNGCFRHIDELMCFMPYGVGEYKVWFYDELDENSFQQHFDNQIKLTKEYKEAEIEKDRLKKNQERFFDEYRHALNKFNNYIKDNRNEYIKNIIPILNCERRQNLEKISKALFNKPFCECTDKFVFFKYYSYKPSIFNRVWYETNDKCICLFPEINDSNIKTNVINEMNKVFSYIRPGIRPNFHFINVKPSNEKEPEGTIHCLIKQRFIKPIISLD